MTRRPSKTTTREADAPRKRPYRRPQVRTTPATEKQALDCSGTCGCGVDEESSCGFGPA
jgi:hypothetical protein